MDCFSDDRDILMYEPALFDELHFADQVLCTGQGGSLVGTTFTASMEHFIAKGVQPGGVIHLVGLSGYANGAYEIVSVDSATQLTVSILRPNVNGDSISPGNAADVTYRVSTFLPQAVEVAYALTRQLRLQPGDPTSPYQIDDVIDTRVLRRLSTFIIIAGAYATLADGGEMSNHYWTKSLHYQELFESGLEGCRIAVGVLGKGVYEWDVQPDSIQLLRR